ncbi:hypothetical protein [Pelagicoccus albus]|uniref:Uncharacterized protein n=1 Tax=Pelagicoccus albus TaxID=415222 RepID=A0A7X1B950_9BACT|nr:hypothetical protein [Pelagicoccus albus]MBC2606673.1 hypothetical protein [Pelagicoccus albus]
MKFILKLLLPLSFVNVLVAQVETFFFDTPLAATESSTVLETGTSYRVLITGTWSVWKDQNTCGGTPETSVMYPTEGSKNGKAYADAGYIFAYPEESGLCGDDEIQIPAATGLIFWDGSEWTPLRPSLDEYRNDHTYEYIIVGAGETFQIQTQDDIPEDNYGQLKIEIFVAPSAGIYSSKSDNVKIDFVGVLQTSEDGEQWEDISPQPESPYLISEPEEKALFRVRKEESE